MQEFPKQVQQIEYDSVLLPALRGCNLCQLSGRYVGNPCGHEPSGFDPSMQEMSFKNVSYSESNNTIKAARLSHKFADCGTKKSHHSTVALLRRRGLLLLLLL